MKTILVLFFFMQLVPFDGFSQTFPGKKWEVFDDFENDGWNMIQLEKAYQFLVDSTSITGLVVIHKGKMIIDYGNTTENSYIASCRKSVTAMLFGPHVTSGKIDLNLTIRDLNIDDIGGLSESEKEATIKNIISAKSGVFHQGSNRGDFLKFAPERGSIESGNYWLYSNWDFNVAQHILELKTQSSVFSEIERTLAKPLQMQDWDINLQRTGGDTTISIFPAKHMVFSTRDMARIGLLMLNKGSWNGEKVLEESWVEEMIDSKTTFKEINNNVPVFKIQDSILVMGICGGYGRIPTITDCKVVILLWEL